MEVRTWKISQEVDGCQLFEIANTVSKAREIVAIDSPVTLKVMED